MNKPQREFFIDCVRRAVYIKNFSIETLNNLFKMQSDEWIHYTEFFLNIYSTQDNQFLLEEFTLILLNTSSCTKIPHEWLEYVINHINNSNRNKTYFNSSEIKDKIDNLIILGKLKYG